ncbi:apolipoprotein A1/A4/E family protein [Microbacterium sp. OVT16B]|uniref:apolipoprotein A1/A4/E family protein n=1 Tax=Microbacterium sp. OVT16B TaxID=2862682 RepID=UPI001CBAD755|nr:apolipoprotein A1/A4/E family protein [Microbacterium sp. OVT16B]
MSLDTLTVLIGAVGAVVSIGASMFAGAGWIVRRIDGVESKLTHRIDGVESKLTARIDDVESKLTARIDDVETKLTAGIDDVETTLTARIDALASDVVEVKIAVARLEGPPRHLVVAGR